MTNTVTVTRRFTAAALDNEISRRAKNRKRVGKGEKKARTASFVLPELKKADVAAIKAGEIVRVEFKTGRVEFVGLKG